MKIGLIGLGRMGHAIAWRLIKGGHEVWGFDGDANTLKTACVDGVKPASSIKNLANNVNIFWLMVPAGDPVDTVINELVKYTKPSSATVIIDGGNSNFKDSVRRYQALKSPNIDFLDCGTSGGLHGKEIGFSLMVGGDKAVFENLDPIFKSIAASGGYAYMGPAGAGHYVKMIHNGIEYALLQSYAEGFQLLKEGRYKDLDLEKISDVWNHGSIIRSWILELAHDVFAHDQNLTEISGKIGENKTGQWTLDEAKEQNIPVDLIERSLQIRATSRKTGGNYATKIVAMLRNRFGGHPLAKKD
jgi:6-phosphogluconate dehydrogenase